MLQCRRPSLCSTLPSALPAHWCVEWRNAAFFSPSLSDFSCFIFLLVLCKPISFHSPTVPFSSESASRWSHAMLYVTVSPGLHMQVDGLGMGPYGDGPSPLPCFRVVDWKRWTRFDWHMAVKALLLLPLSRLGCCVSPAVFRPLLARLDPSRILKAFPPLRRSTHHTFYFSHLPVPFRR
ncbi:hypothetical protein F4818DRAFT_166099 [Hypoxylon cercidicola]|nr:hypothetical protein F4818DRAFT_166099 [Hypoxylon cercidicola]